MSRQFTATLLLDEPWSLDVDGLAAAVRRLFPQIGRIDAVPGQAEGRDSGVLMLEGANVVVQAEAAAADEAVLHPPMKILRTWDPFPVMERHRATLSISCGGRLPGLEGGEAYAAATHFVAAAATQIVPARAVVWEPSWSVLMPGDFLESARPLLNGTMPMGAWISFAPVVPRGYAPSEATGMVTYGMRPFTGRELELAPRPGDSRTAFRCLNAVTRLILDKGLTLYDGQRLEDTEGSFSLVARERTFWLRRDLSAMVLVADDSVVDGETLRPRPRSDAASVA